MFRMHLRSTGEAYFYSNLANYLENPPFPAPDDFLWVEGDPPAEATVYIPLTLSAQLDAIFKEQSLPLQMAFAGLKALYKEYAEAEDWDKVREIFQDAPIPVGLEETAEPVRDQLLAVLDNP